jgi:hypothetical protein
MDEPMTPTWTYTRQELNYIPAVIHDETGDLIATIHNYDNDEANAIAALIAAAPRLLAVCQMALDVGLCDEPTGKQLTELWQAAAEAIEAATECEVSE